MKKLALLLCIASPVLAAGPPPIEHFFNNPSFHSPQLSPDGRLLAIISGSPGARDALVVISLADRKVHTAARFAKADVSHFQWVNDRRLLFGMDNKELAQGQINAAPGLYAADYDGANARQLAARDWNMPLSTGTSIASKMLPPNTYMLGQTGAQVTDTVYGGIL